jgi:serine protease Do
VVEQLKAGGKVARGWLGVMIQEVTPELAQSFGLDKPRGALIGQVLADGPAQKAELKTGDIIVAFNGQPVQHSSDLPLMVGRTRPGTSATLALVREGKELNLNAKIEQLPDEAKRQPTLNDEAPRADRLGLTVVELPPEKRKPGSSGVLVKEVADGPAASAGIRPGDIISRINNVEVSDAGQFVDLLKQLPAGRPLPILVRRENGALFLALTIPEKE